MEREKLISIPLRKKYCLPWGSGITLQKIFCYFAEAEIFRGWGLSAQGECARSIELMREGLALREDSGVRYVQPYYRSLMAESHLGSGQSAEALATFDTALSETQETEEFWFQAELYRGRGELFLTQPHLDEHEAEACFGKAIEIACA